MKSMRGWQCGKRYQLHPQFLCTQHLMIINGTIKNKVTFLKLRSSAAFPRFLLLATIRRNPMDPNPYHMPHYRIMQLPTNSQPELPHPM